MACTRPRVLVVDDDPQIRAMLQRFLEHEGYVVRTVPTGRAALAPEVLADTDLVLLGLRLPAVDGLIMGRALRAARPTLPIVIWAAALDTELRRAAAAVGATACLPMPFTLRALRECLVTCLGGRRPVDAPRRHAGHGRRRSVSC